MSRTRVALGAAAVLAVAVTLTFGYLAAARDRALAGSIIQAVAATITLAGVCGTALWRFTRGRTRPSATDIGEHLDRFADAVTRQWENAVMERGLRYPTPVPMGWKWSSLCISASADDAAGLPSVVRTAPLPGTDRVTPADLAGGDVEDLFRVYAGLDSGRILLTGRAGAGKSSAGILLLLRALQHRNQQKDRARVPVPVMLTFYGWDPRRQDFASWLTDRLVGDYPTLAAAGRTAVAAMVRDGRIVVFLDGLDEIPEDLRPVVVRALDHQVTHRIVLMTRVGEMVRTAHNAHLSGAAAVELLPVPANHAVDYLLRVSVSPTRPGCRAVADLLTRAPEGPLARAVAQPLMLALLRDRLAADDDVHELLELNRAGNAEGIEECLLDRVIALAYRSPGRISPTAARELLNFLAANLASRGVREFAWWDMPKWLPQGPRTLATTILVTVVWGIGNGATMMADRLVLGPSFGTARDVLITALMSGPNTAMFAALAVAQPGYGAAARRRAAFSRTVIQYGCVCGAFFHIGVQMALPLRYAPFDLAGTVVFTLLLAKRPSLRWSDRRLSLAFDNPATLSAPVGACAVFLGNFIRFLPDGVLSAFGGAVGQALTLGLLLYFLQPPRGVTQARLVGPRRQSLLGRATLVVGLSAATAFGLITLLMLVEARTGDTFSRSLLTLAAALLFLLVILPTIGLFPQRDLSGGVPASPLRLMRQELRSRVAAGCALGLALSLPIVPSAMLFESPPGVTVDAWAVNLLFAAETVLLIAAVGGPMFAVASSHTWQTFLLGLQMRAAGLGPWQLPRYLDDAHRRGVLRALGPVYQFRHARLQDRLSRPATPPHSPRPTSEPHRAVPTPLNAT
ncbi:hypothetical protein [Actinoplanes auranticolor]|uniref:NACHT domain-containing protein n=1 Tax=Actinoplanes auranticolor TaxID=47988 RepID=A0A919VXL7_9ACTN|nr:hypothetical protein [Actinoplanes auranticolor]GIM80831.1 hypothetical protein Aau02nite_92250 [Actinoplanes auranticolor]